MYGIIHRAVRDMVIETKGEALWAQLCSKHEFTEQIFEPMDSYPDAQTYGLIIAAAQELGMPLDVILFQFGIHGMIFHLTGSDLFGFLEGLDAMHERIVLTFSDLQMPYFSLERLDETSALLHYRSHREGLAPFVLGLLDCLAQHFEVDARVEHLKRKADGESHYVFQIIEQRP